VKSWHVPLGRQVFAARRRRRAFYFASSRVERSAAFRMNWFRYRALLRRCWWILGLTVALGVAGQAWWIMRHSRAETSSREIVRAEQWKTSQVNHARTAGAPDAAPKHFARQLLPGLISGLLLGGLILFFVDRSNDRVGSSVEVIEHFSEPVLAQIPNVAHTRTESGLPLIELEDARYSYAEAFRSLRASLMFMPNHADVKTLAITSAVANEGKSTIASNLAITMAAAGARVLLVDADLRRGDLAALFGVHDAVGLSTVVREETRWEDALQTTEHEALSLMPRGPVVLHPDELLGRPIFRTLVNNLKREFDVVIFNAPPVLPADYTATFAPSFDGTLLVVRAQFTSTRATHHALDALSHRQANVLGLILNCVDPQTPDYYYYQSPKYHPA